MPKDKTLDPNCWNCEFLQGSPDTEYPSYRCMLPNRNTHLLVKTQDVIEKGLWRLWPIINVDRTLDIPRDYPGAMGVPITYMDKHDPERFELLGMTHKGRIGDRQVYARLLIRNLHPDLPEVLNLTEWFERMGETLIVEEVSDAAE